MRRLPGEGSIRKRVDGRYEVRIKDPETGRRRSIFAATEADALSKLKGAQRAIDDGVGLGSARLTCATYFSDWLTGKRPSVKATTYERYRSLLKHADPLGKIPVRRLTPADLRKLYASLHASGLHPRTVGHVHRVLHNALGQAADDGVAARNVAALVSPPRVPQREMVTLDPDESRRLLAAAASHRLGALFVVALTTGARQGEILGLRWPDIDFSSGTMTISRTLVGVRKGTAIYQDPKTTSANRTVTLSRTALDALRAHRQTQRQERLAAGSWANHNLVFTNASGVELQAAHFLRDIWAPLRKAAGIRDDATFHALRHSAASLSLAAGVPVATVSAMLGHANAGITMRLYAHAVPGTQRLAADAMDRLAAGS